MSKDSKSTARERSLANFVTSHSNQFDPSRPGIIRDIPVEQLTVSAHQAKLHPPSQIQKIGALMLLVGFLGLIVANALGRVLAGHARLAAAKLVGFKTVPCLIVNHLSPAAERAFMLADNKLAEESIWDEEQLTIELLDLSTMDLPFDFEVTGFDSIDLDRLLGPEPLSANPDGEASNPDDDLPLLRNDVVTRVGDIWCVGDHRLACGSAEDPEALRRLLLGETARQVFTDPPYNVEIGGHVTSKRGFREFPMASGEMSDADYIQFLSRTCANLAGSVANGAILHICIDWRHVGDVMTAAQAAGLVLKNICVWVKPNAGMGSFYRSQHELVLVFKAGKGKHVNTFGLGKRGRNRSNVWRYPSVIGPRRGLNDPDAGGHPTIKPVTLVIDAIRDCSHRGDIILDVFGGSGTTLIAAERMGRRARMLELDPAYCDLIIRRWQRLTGRAAIRESDGMRFDAASGQQSATAANGVACLPRRESGHE